MAQARNSAIWGIMAGLEIRFRYRFEAAHRFLGGATKCRTPHGHSWHATLIMESPTAELNSQQMTEEFSSLKKNWKAFIQETVDHSYFHHPEDSVAKILQTEMDDFRGLSCPGEPTTELIAALFLQKALWMYRETKLNVKAILLEETETNHIYLDRNGLELLVRQYQAISAQNTAWWNSSSPTLRT